MILLKTRFNGCGFVQAPTKVDGQPGMVTFRIPHEFNVYKDGRKIGFVMEHPEGWFVNTNRCYSTCKTLDDVAALLRERYNDKVRIEGYDEKAHEEAKALAKKICKIEKL